MLNEEEAAAILKAVANTNSTLSKREHLVLSSITDDMQQFLTVEKVKDEYLKEARELFAQICAFDRKTRLLSGNRVRGLCENNSYRQGVIECYDGKIELDLTRLTELDFITHEELLNSNANPGTYFITEKNRTRSNVANEILQKTKR